MIIFFILLETQEPKLETPEVIIYGEKKVKLKIEKKDLIPDTIAKYELPLLKMHPLSLYKLSNLYKFSPSYSTFDIIGGAGGSGFINAHYGKNNYFFHCSYNNNIRKIKNDLNLYGNYKYKDIKIGTEIFVKNYEKDINGGIFLAEYTEPYLLGSSKFMYSNIEKGIFLKVKYIYPKFSIITETNVDYDSLFATSCYLSYYHNFNLFSISCGGMIFNASPYILPYFMTNLYKFYFAFRPSYSIMTKKELIEYNRLATSIHIDKRILIRAGTNFSIFNFNFDWTINYPYFVDNTLSDTNLYTISCNISPTDIVGIEIKYNFIGKPEYLPKFIFISHIPYKNFMLTVEYGDIGYLGGILTWQLNKKISFFIEGRNLFDRNNEIFDTFYDDKKILFGGGIKL